jgi:hypothetical protein
MVEQKPFKHLEPLKSVVLVLNYGLTVPFESKQLGICCKPGEVRFAPSSLIHGWEAAGGKPTLVSG